VTVWASFACQATKRRGYCIFTVPPEFRRPESQTGLPSRSRGARSNRQFSPRHASRAESLRSHAQVERPQEGYLLRDCALEACAGVHVDVTARGIEDKSSKEMLLESGPDKQLSSRLSCTHRCASWWSD
jgi:hypothetical protein